MVRAFSSILAYFSGTDSYRKLRGINGNFVIFFPTFCLSSLSKLVKNIMCNCHHSNSQLCSSKLTIHQASRLSFTSVGPKVQLSTFSRCSHRWSISMNDVNECSITLVQSYQGMLVSEPRRGWVQSWNGTPLEVTVNKICCGNFSFVFIKKLHTGNTTKFFSCYLLELLASIPGNLRPQTEPDNMDLFCSRESVDDEKIDQHRYLKEKQQITELQSTPSFGHPDTNDTPLLRTAAKSQSTPMPYGHPDTTDTTLLRTAAKSLTIKKCMETTSAITDSCYNGHVMVLRVSVI